MPKEYSAGAVIFRKTDRGIKFLLMYRKAQGIYKDGWYFVRGLVGGGEGEIDTLRREVREETGIDDLFIVKGFEMKTQWFYRNEDKQTVFKEAKYFLAQTMTDKIKLSEEHDDYAWLSFSEAMARIKFQNDKDVLKKAFDFMHL